MILTGTDVIEYVSHKSHGLVTCAICKSMKFTLYQSDSGEDFDINVFYAESVPKISLIVMCCGNCGNTYFFNKRNIEEWIIQRQAQTDENR